MKSLLFVGLAMIGACAANASPQPQSELAAEAPAYIAPAQAAHAVPADTRQTMALAGLDCDIVRTRTANGVELHAVASSGASIAGEYEFVITKRDRAGSSDIMQSGEFALESGETTLLGSAEVSVDRGGYRARLELISADGATCVAEARR